MKIGKYAFLLSLVLAVASGMMAAKAEEVTFRHNGLTLNANLSLADGKTLEDGIILMTHALLQHNRMEIMRVVTALFREHGYSTLAMTYSAGLDNRRGPYDCAIPHRHTIEGHLEEIGLWVDWLKQRGAGPIFMAGHSGGANRITHFMVGRTDPSIRKVVLFAPGTSDHYSRSAAGYEARYRTDIEPILEKARSLVAAGKGDALINEIDFLFCPRTKVSAESFLSFYDPAKLGYRLIPTQMQQLRKPTIIVAASEDNVAPDLARLVRPALQTNSNLRLIVIEGCGHFFRDLCADDAVEAAVKFLEE